MFIRVLLTLLHPSSVMSWLFVRRAPGWEETNVTSVLGCLQGTGKKMGQNGTRWLGSEEGKEEER